jgi:general secretion pathway protein A
MYESFFGLNENPFNLNPDPDYLYMSEGHENAHTHLEYAVMESKGFVVLTGEIGSGKTTLLNLFLSEIADEFQVGLINQTFVTPVQFLRKMCREFELDNDVKEKEGMTEILHDFLLGQYASGKRVILIVDEAQNLPTKTLEEVRMLSNLESQKNHLIQIILVGQPELKYKLRKKELEQFAQRITVHCHLDALNENEVKGYIHYRLRVAGAKRANMFTDDAVATIAKISQGIPRMINILCDAALVYAFADSKDFINKSIIDDVVRERAAGGIFFDEESLNKSKIHKPDEKGRQNLQAGYTAAENLYANERMLRLEERMQNYEEKVNLLNKELTGLKKLHNERDTLMIELFKLLHKTMKGRYFLLKSAESQLSANHDLPHTLQKGPSSKVNN